MIIDPAAELARSDMHINHAWELRKNIPGLSMQQSYYAMFAVERARSAAHDPEFQDRGHRQVQQYLTSLYRDDRTDQNPGKILQRAYDWKQEEDYGAGGAGIPSARDLIKKIAHGGRPLSDLQADRPGIRNEVRSAWLNQQLNRGRPIAAKKNDED